MVSLPENITCPECGMTSWNPSDVLYGYCGNCSAFTSPPVETYEFSIDQRTDLIYYVGHRGASALAPAPPDDCTRRMPPWE